MVIKCIAFFPGRPFKVFTTRSCMLLVPTDNKDGVFQDLTSSIITKFANFFLFSRWYNSLDINGQAHNMVSFVHATIKHARVPAHE